MPSLVVVGGSDPSPEARAAFGKLAGEVELFEESEAMLSNLEPDWVVVAAPAAQHADLCVQALGQGAHVFCEKPFVESLRDADRVIAAAESAGRVVVVNHEFPSMPIHAKLVDAARSATYGRPLFLQAWQNVQLGEEDQAGWRSEWKTMQEFGTHVIDLSMCIFGGAPSAVTARMPSPTSDKGDLIDLVSLEFENGGSASIVLNRICSGRHRYLDLRLDTENASLRSSVGGRMSVSLSVAPSTHRPGVELDLAKGGMAWIEHEAGREVLATNPGDVFAHATGVHLRSTLEAVARGEEPSVSAVWARQVVRVVEAAYESAAKGCTVSLERADG